MLFRSRREKRIRNGKAGSKPDGSSGVARSSKTGGFEARQDHDMICDDSSVDSDAAIQNDQDTAISPAKDNKSIAAKSSATTSIATTVNYPSSVSAGVSRNSRDEVFRVQRRHGERGNSRILDAATTTTSLSSKSRTIKKCSAADSVATSQVEGCCTVGTTLTTLSPDCWNVRQVPANTALPNTTTNNNNNQVDWFRQFELSNPDFCTPSPPPPPPLPPPTSKTSRGSDKSRRLKGPIDVDADDVASYCSSIDSDLGDRINVSDKKLLESDSPGSLRLTADALQRHHRKALLSSVRPQQMRTTPPQSYDSWKLKRDEQQWYREQQKARDEELYDQTWKLQMQQRERAATSTTILSSDGSLTARPRRASGTRKWSLGEVSQQSSNSSRLIGETLEEELSQPTSNKSKTRLVPSISSKISGNVSQSSVSSRRLLGDDSTRSCESNQKPSVVSASSRQSTWGSNSRDTVSSRPRSKVSPHDPTIPPKPKAAVGGDAAKQTKTKHSVLPPLGLRNFFAPDDDVADLSLAPLTSLEDVAVPPIPKQQHSTIGHTPKFGALRNLVPHGIAGKVGKKGTAQLANDLLQQERQREMQSRIAQERAEQEERDRIQRLRTAELERQRKLEAQARLERNDKNIKEERTTRKSKQEKDWNVNSFADDARDCTGQDVSTITSTSSSMAPCVVCGTRQRTHIAMPCMHYTFCEACVTKMLVKKESSCPVCSTPGVVFSRVLT